MTNETELEFDENRFIAQRREKLNELREQGNAFPNDFRRNVMNAELTTEYEHVDAEALKAEPRRVKLAGRLMGKRVMGKASFAKVRDMSGDMQLYVKRDDLPEGVYAEFKRWDMGDIIAAEGVMFRTQKGELSVAVDSIRLLTKSLRPLPEKFHGLSDQETRYRQRYVDLIMNEETRKLFKLRTQIIDGVRRYLMSKDFLEVETPMMQAIPGGATARPFTTYHNALDMDLFLRIAPELYLKRLVVGGFERVFEINRNFRNEGLSTRHNPEFTMVEFYQAYADYHDLMDLTEDMLRTITQEVLGTTQVHYQGLDIDFGKPFVRMSVKESILHFNPDLKPEQLETLEAATAVAEALEIPLKPTYGLGKV
jgi:lysyl-tRNA synthetase class 2